MAPPANVPDNRIAPLLVVANPVEMPPPSEPPAPPKLPLDVAFPPLPPVVVSNSPTVGSVCVPLIVIDPAFTASRKPEGAPAPPVSSARPFTPALWKFRP